MTAWIRVLLCSGPRQVLNALTLKSVYEAQLAVSEKNVGDSIMGFFDKIKTLAEDDYRQALILSGMCFTLVVWVFSALFLLAAFLFWILFLWHWIPKTDGGLTGYCERKVTMALMDIVTKKVNKALARQEADRIRAEFKNAKVTGEKPRLDRTATLPDIGAFNEDKLPSMPMLGRNDTMVTLPAYSSRPGTPGGMDQKRPIPSRTATMASSASYSSRAPLVGASSDMGYGRSASPAPTVPELNRGNYPPPRSMTANSHAGSHTTPNYMGFDSHSRTGTPFTESPSQMHSETMPAFPPPTRSSTANSFMRPQGTPSRGPAATPAPRQYQAYNPNGRGSPSPTDFSHGEDASLPQQRGPRFPPVRSATETFTSQGPQHPPQRSMAASVPPQALAGDYYNESEPSYRARATPAPRFGTPQSQQRPPYGYDVESQRDYRF